MKVAVTGAGGFLGWHLRVHLRAEHGIDAIAISRGDFSSAEALARRLAGVDVVYHLAGVNRAETEGEMESGNASIAVSLAEALCRLDRPVHVVYGNSIQAELDNAYGRGKREAAGILGGAVKEAGGTLANVLLPNIFGEHGRPKYNSFVATFCDVIARGGTPTVTGDRPVPLLHAQDVAAALVEAGSAHETCVHQPDGESHSVKEVLAMLEGFHELYTRGEVPEMTTSFQTNLFNTYRSYVFPAAYPMKASVNADQRGELFETVRSHGRAGQTFVSTTAPGVTRGDHFHIRKFERFFVLQGSAEIALRRVYDDKVVRFRVDGQDRAFVDMPTMWVHNINNVGDDELMTLFWTDQLFDPEKPDTYWEPVEVGAS